MPQTSVGRAAKKAQLLQQLALLEAQADEQEKEEEEEATKARSQNRGTAVQEAFGDGRNSGDTLHLTLTPTASETFQNFSGGEGARSSGGSGCGSSR